MSLFDEKLPYGWNLKDLGGCLLKRPDVPQVPGVTTPMTYFGMWKSYFAWHVVSQGAASARAGASRGWRSVRGNDEVRRDRTSQEA
jgi:jumonji domain-containing protein 2